MDRSRVTGLVLAGGRGTRMGSRDKGLQAFAGEPLVAHAIRRLGAQVGPLVVSARSLERYAAFGWPVVADLTADQAGPLAGIQAGLAVCETAYLVVVPCDAPFFPLDLVERLAAALDDARDDPLDAVFAKTVARTHPVFCLMRRPVAAALDRHLAAGGRSVTGWLHTLRVAAVSFADEAAFRNLNTLEDLDAASLSTRD